jgi:catechol 2,3-dioxygenase-like lactoylglutathione lyase family enzyme
MAHADFPAYLDHLTIAVSDLDRSRAWYTSVLGLRVEFEVPSHSAVALQDSGGFTVFLEKRSDFSGHPMCVLTFRIDDVDKRSSELESRGIAFDTPPRKLFWGYGAELKDPDGYLVRLWDEASMKEKG